MAEASTLDFQKEQARLLRTARTADRLNRKEDDSSDKTARQSSRGRFQKSPSIGKFANSTRLTGTLSKLGGSSRALRWAWLSLFFSGGLTIFFSGLYLIIHGVGRVVMPQIFCKFGSEWPLLSQNKNSSAFLSQLETAAAVLVITLQILLYMGLIILIVSLIVGCSESLLCRVLYRALGIVSKLLPS